MKTIAALTVALSLASTQLAAAGYPAPTYIQNASVTVNLGGQVYSNNWSNGDGYQTFTNYYADSGTQYLRSEVGFFGYDNGEGNVDVLLLGSSKAYNTANQLITFTINFNLSTACEIINQPITAGSSDRWATLDGNAVDTSTLGTTIAAGNHVIVYQIDMSGYGANGYWSGLTAGFNFKQSAVPAPGAIALLGLAGLAGRRRR